MRYTSSFTLARSVTGSPRYLGVLVGAALVAFMLGMPRSHRRRRRPHRWCQASGDGTVGSDGTHYWTMCLEQLGQDSGQDQ